MRGTLCEKTSICSVINDNMSLSQPRNSLVGAGLANQYSISDLGFIDQDFEEAKLCSLDDDDGSESPDEREANLYGKQMMSRMRNEARKTTFPGDHHGQSRHTLIENQLAGLSSQIIAK